MEGDFDGQGDEGGQLAALWQAHPGELWISTWANPVDHGWMTIISHLTPVVQKWLPQAYGDANVARMLAQFPQALTIEPTIALGGGWGANNPVPFVEQYSTISIWEYQLALQNPTQLASVVRVMKGGTQPLITNNGAVLDLRKSYQLEPGETQDACGPWSVSELHYAGLPGHGPRGTAEQVDEWADMEYIRWIGPNVSSDQGGSSIDNMHQFLKDAGLHWWDITGINPQSKQSDDIARLHRATGAGYPVLVTVNEQSVHRRDGSNPYPWQPALGPVNHIFTVVGHTHDGYLLVDDELNQGDNWPDQYSEASIECHWACTVRVMGPDTVLPWLKPIPGEDPLQWLAGFNAQNFGGGNITVSDKFLQDYWNSTAAFFGGTAPDYTTGIANKWKSDVKAGHWRGAPLTQEYKSDWKGNPTTPIQVFSGGFYTDEGGTHYWHRNA